MQIKMAAKAFPVLITTMIQGVTKQFQPIELADPFQLSLSALYLVSLSTALYDLIKAFTFSEVSTDFLKSKEPSLFVGFWYFHWDTNFRRFSAESNIYTW